MTRPTQLVENFALTATLSSLISWRRDGTRTTNFHRKISVQFAKSGRAAISGYLRYNREKKRRRRAMLETSARRLTTITKGTRAMAISDSTTTTTEPVFIYALRDPRTDDIRYIGKSLNPRERFVQHLRSRRNSDCARWIQSLRCEGLEPTLEILEQTTEADWQARERFRVADALANGCDLTNADGGGWGGRKPTERTRLKLSRSHIGKKHSAEARAKMSRARKGVPKSEAHKAFMSSRPHTWGAKISAGKAGHRHSGEAKEAMREAKLRHYDDRGRKSDAIVAHLVAHPEAAVLSCRALAALFDTHHHHAAEAKRRLGLAV